MTAGIRFAGLAAGLALVAWAVVDARTAAGGWLVGLVFWSGPVLGGLLLALVGRLTGGRWRGAVEPLAGSVPALWLLILPVVAGLSVIYPWVQPRGPEPGHAGAWLGPTGFMARSAVALAGWSALSLFTARDRPGRLWPALGLVAHAIFLTLVGVDWITSLRPGWVSSDLAMSLAAQEVAAAVAVAGLVGGGADERVARDLSGLLAAGVLGAAYLAFMDYLVVWYGDLPDKIAWYLERTHGLWWTLAPAAFVIGAVVPLGLLAAGRAPWPKRLKRAAWPALAGLLLYQLFLIAPPFGPAAVAAAILAVAAQGAIVAEVGRTVSRFAAGGLAHG